MAAVPVRHDDGDERRGAAGRGQLRLVGGAEEQQPQGRADSRTGQSLGDYLLALRPGSPCPLCATELRAVRSRAGSVLLACPSCGAELEALEAAG